MIVATRPLIDCCPIVPAAMEGRQIVQWDKDSCADAGFLKIDLLGLGMLSAVERCVELIARTRGERIDLSRIPYDDPATYECIQNADTTGVFQIESRAQMASLRRTRPETLQDITIQVAIVRPGPIQGGAVNPYIERRQRLRVDPDYQVPYDHPVARAGAAETLGTIIFQDQVLEVAIAFAGFSVGEAEGLRRAMSRKRSEAAIQAYHERFVAGRPAQARGRRRDRGAGVRDGQGLLRLRLSQGPRRRLRPARLPVDLAARPLHAGVPVLAAQRAADGLLPARRAGPRGPAPRHRGAGRRTSTRARPSAMSSSRAAASGGVPAGRVRIGLGYVRGVRAEEVRELVAARERAGGSAACPISPPSGRGRPRWSCWPGQGPAISRPSEGVGRRGRGGRRGRRVGPADRSLAARRDRARAAVCPGAPSSRFRSTSRRRRSCARSPNGRRCSPTTAPPV